MPWSSWIDNEALSNQDSSQFHVYRARQSPTGNWEYEQQSHSRNEFSSLQQLLRHLNTPTSADTQSNEGSLDGSADRGNDDDDDNDTEDSDSDSDDDEGHDDKVGRDNTSTVQGIIGPMQNLGISQVGYPTNPASNNPFIQPTTSSEFNPFRGLSPANHSPGYPVHSGSYPYSHPNTAIPRSATPGPNYLPHNRYTTSMHGGGIGGHHGSFGPSAGSGYPSIPGYPVSQQHNFGSPALPMGYGQAQSYGGPLQDPSKIRRSASAIPASSRSTSSKPAPVQPGVSGKPSGRFSRNFKVVKPKDQRSYFKPGRVFVAWWSQPTPESNNPFGEATRFVVLKPHKRHSLCLAIHSYNGKGTAARSVRARDHVIVYSGSRPPRPLPDEDKAVLERRQPIKVRLDPKAEDLASASRLNLSKFYTFEHNIGVAPVGKISSRDIDIVKRYCAEVQGLLVPVDTPSRSLADVSEEDEDEDEDDDEEED